MSAYERRKNQTRLMDDLESGGSRLEPREVEGESQERAPQNITKDITLGGGNKEADTEGADNKKKAGGMMMSTGNPYLMAGGFALSAMGNAESKKLKREQAEINNEITRREKVMQMMGQLGQGMGRLG